MKEDRPFPEQLQELLRERGWTHRELSRQLIAEYGDKGWNEGGGTKNTSVSRWIRGNLHPTRVAMERVAKVMRIDPKVFPEWRLEVLRDALNWRVVGVRRALQTLERLTASEGNTRKAPQPPSRSKAPK